MACKNQDFYAYMYHHTQPLLYTTINKHSPPAQEVSLREKAWPSFQHSQNSAASKNNMTVMLHD
jgi:hypothetical protein